MLTGPFVSYNLRRNTMGRKQLIYKAFDAALRVSDGPTFTVPISNVTVSVGREATLACVVENLSNFKVKRLRLLYTFEENKKT